LAVDWLTPRGSPGNGNPLSAIYEPELFPLSPNGRMPPFSIGEPFIASLMEDVSIEPLGELVAPGRQERFLFIITPRGDISHALGLWDQPEHTHLLENVSDTAIQCIRSGRATLVIDDSWE